MTDTMQELKQMKIWVLYLLKHKPDGRFDKVPFSTLGGVTGTSEKYSGTQVSYKEVKVAQAKLDNKNVGLGFKIPPGFFLYDIDDKDLGSPYVAQRLERFN